MFESADEFSKLRNLGKKFESADVFFGRGPSENSQEILKMRGLRKASRGDHLIIIFGQNV